MFLEMKLSNVKGICGKWWVTYFYEIIFMEDLIYKVLLYNT